MSSYRQSVAGRMVARMWRAAASKVVTSGGHCEYPDVHYLGLAAFNVGVRNSFTEEGVIIEVAHKLMTILQDIHEKARRPMTPEMNERRKTLSERQVARQSSASSYSEERFHTAPEEARMEVSLSDPPVFGSSTCTCSSSSKSSCGEPVKPD
ncbi:hypothetical protein DPMN_060308 [Dreissena polymorpha]|uniref:Uncharacterized protein n=1 Tax=Dreissena polymorpha TaxID=45954 RepID=A0A9D4C503_DREPO|nr:hypothetical protein DPMN_060308 [Dreissena polymorpha]